MRTNAGTDATSFGGAAETVLEAVSNFMPSKACFCCMEEALSQGGDINTAEAMCDMYCDRCATAERVLGLGHACKQHAGELHWQLRRCSRCADRGRVCYSVVNLGHCQDSGAPADTAIRQRSALLAEVSARNPAFFPVPTRRPTLGLPLRRVDGVVVLMASTASRRWRRGDGVDIVDASCSTPSS